ncbi:S1 family peptidase [Bdellovibrio sp. HCB337]|uniref:S1 family peptidase n=1 Tax=Bdellovibrio sp. HCB337 TaxID=3394358 RepID=UPI0039A46EBC
MNFKFLFAATALVLAACAKDANNTGSVTAQPASQVGVFGGDDVNPNDIVARTTVGLYNSRVGFICTGSLYGSNMILTAGHCLEGAPQDLEVRFGVDMRAPLFVRAVIAGKRSPLYTGKIGPNMADIAVLKYEGTIPTEYGFRSVNLLKDYRLLNKGTDIVAAGYGIKGPTMGHGSGTLRKVTLEVQNPNYSLTEMSVNQGVFKGVCNGDSGGPAFLKGTDGNLYLWGLTSNGAGIPKVRACMFRSVFTRVDAYIPWILELARTL